MAGHFRLLCAQHLSFDLAGDGLVMHQFGVDPQRRIVVRPDNCRGGEAVGVGDRSDTASGPCGAAMGVTADHPAERMRHQARDGLRRAKTPREEPVAVRGGDIHGNSVDRRPPTQVRRGGIVVVMVSMTDRHPWRAEHGGKRRRQDHDINRFEPSGLATRDRQ
jgi:hypothetical protein